MRAAFPSMPDEADNEVCEDGTAAHWLASEVWEGRYPTEGSIAPNGRVLTDEMFDAVDLYHNVLRDAEWAGGETYCEQTQDCSVIYPDMSGTPDAFTVTPGRLRIVDLKFGYRFVEVWNNYQLLIYAAALCAKFHLNDLTQLELVIVQPRSNHREGVVRKWRTTLGAVQHHIQFLRDRAVAAMGDSPTCTPNPGCIDCAGRHVCEALANAAYRAVEVSYSALPLDTTPEIVGKELTMLKRAAKHIEARINGLEMEADRLLRNGSHVPGWTLTATFARETWKQGGAQAIVALESYYPEAKGKLTKPPKTITPNQARAFLPANIVAMWSHRPSTGVRLTKQDPLAAIKAFDNGN
jgi:Protein of unknown function (DUF2800)